MIWIVRSRGGGSIRSGGLPPLSPDKIFNSALITRGLIRYIILTNLRAFMLHPLVEQKLEQVYFM